MIFKYLPTRLALGAAILGLTVFATLSRSDEKPATAETPELKKAVIDGTGEGWRELTGEDFVNVNCEEDTWTWDGNSVACTGSPVGVIRSTKTIKNFEMVCEWRHNKPAGNSGVFAWASQESIDKLAAGNGQLPDGIEVQILDLAYETNWEKSKGAPSDWFTSHGDVFPTGPAKMKPFPPVTPNGTRSFPTKRLTKGVGEWNHYYIRAINGEVRLWVNGEEVSGGTNCDPADGYLCLESEGSPIDFKNLRIRELP